VKYSALQYRAVFSFTRDASTKGKIAKGVYAIPMATLQDLCKTYLEPVGLRMRENKKGAKDTISIERNDIDASE
jgi:hypothetical protein